MRDRQVLDRAGRGLGDDRRDAGRAVPRDHEAVRPGALARARDGAEVARVGDAVERDDERVAGARAARRRRRTGTDRTSATTPWWSGRSASAVDAVGDGDATCARPELLDPRHRLGGLARARRSPARAGGRAAPRARAAARRRGRRGAACRRGQPSSGTTCGPCGVSRTLEAERRDLVAQLVGARVVARGARGGSLDGQGAAPPRTSRASVVERREPEHVERAHEQVGGGAHGAPGGRRRRPRRC